MAMRENRVEEEEEEHMDSFITECLESTQGGSLSLEDVALADSFLIKDPEIPDGNLESLSDALLEILTFQLNPHETMPDRDHDDPKGTEIEMCSSSRDEARDDYDDIPISEEETNAFLPKYKDGFSESENAEFRSSLSNASENEGESNVEGIFRVWDLNIPAVEDELTEQLNKALLENCDESVPSIYDDYHHSIAQKGTKEDPLDDVIAGIGNLSLNQIR